MAALVTAKVNSLIRRQRGKTAIPSLWRETYHRALQHYWRQESQQVIALVTEVIAEEVGTANAYPFYRLWIEQLAASKDFAALRLLGKHFFTLSLHDPDPLTWVAFRGLVHLELDEMQACDLFAPALCGRTDNPYCLEFSTRYLLRSWDSQEFLALPLLDYVGPLGDFFHWQAIAQRLHINGRDKALAKVLGHTSRSYPDSPLASLYGAYGCLDRARVEEAVAHSQALAKRYPRRLEYAILLAYCHMQLAAWDQAIAQLNSALGLPGGAKEPDVYALLAQCYRQKAGQKVDSASWRKSKRCLRLAQEHCHRQGRSDGELNAIFAEQRQWESQQGKDILPSDFADSHFSAWGVELSARRVHELATLEEEALEMLYRPLGPHVRSDDLVFFFGKDHIYGSSLRVLALYRAVGHATWHPSHGSVSALQLLKRFEEPLVVDLDLGAAKGVKAKTAHREFVAGSFHLGEKNFDAIRHAVRELVAAEGSRGFNRYFDKSS